MKYTCFIILIKKNFIYNNTSFKIDKQGRFLF